MFGLLRVVFLVTWAFKGCRRRYCFKAIVLSCQSKIQDGGLARRAPKRTRNLVTYEYVKVNLYMWMKVITYTCGTECALRVRSTES